MSSTCNSEDVPHKLNVTNSSVGRRYPRYVHWFRQYLPHTNCGSCSCDVDWAYKRITVRLWDYFLSETYSEYVYILDKDGYLDYAVLARDLGVEELLAVATRCVTACHFCTRRSTRERAVSTKAKMEGKSYLTVVENPRGLNKILREIPRQEVSLRMIRVRWYPTPGSTFEETVEPLDKYGRLSLGQIARRHSIANVHVFNPRNKKRFITDRMRALFYDEFEKVMFPHGFIALTDAAVPMKPEGQVICYELSQAWNRLTRIFGTATKMPKASQTYYLPQSDVTREVNESKDKSYCSDHARQSGGIDSYPQDSTEKSKDVSPIPHPLGTSYHRSQRKKPDLQRRDPEWAYSLKRHPNCPNCICGSRWANKRITIRLCDYFLSETYSEFEHTLDKDGVLDYEELAHNLGVTELMPVPVRSVKDGFGRIYPSTIREPPRITRSMMEGRKYLIVVENSRDVGKPQRTVPQNEVSVRSMRVRWYSTPGTGYEESVEPLDKYGRLSLGQIARQRGVANVHVFDPKDNKRFATDRRRALFFDEFAGIVDPDGYLALTDAAVAMRTKKPRGVSSVDTGERLTRQIRPVNWLLRTMFRRPSKMRSNSQKSKDGL